MSSNATTTAEARDKTPKTSELVLSDKGAEVRLVLDQSNPEFEAWLERQGAETVVFLPAHDPRKKPRDRWSSRKLERLRGRVGDAVAVAGEQRFEGPQPPVPGLFLPGMTRARARALALKLSVSQFFWARAGEPFEVHRTKALGLDDVFDDSVWQIAREGMRDLMAAIRRFADESRGIRQLVLGSYWWLAVFVLGMVGLGYALNSFVVWLPGWCMALPPALVVGLRLRQLYSTDKLPEREFSTAESDAAWGEVAASRAFAWCIAAGGVVILEVCRALWRTGDGALVVVGDSVTHIVVCIWLLQAVSFSRTADDVWSRAIGSVIG
ncbi:MAG: hypothetical protein VYE77_06385, partial [Planctomycetota bacterium]|nr:hypothetical protein [Planctomycetota bacterium]